MPTFTLIDGPRRYLNDRGDGPFAFTPEAALRQYDATRWLYEYALNAVEDHGAAWSDFDGAEDLRRIYAVILRDDDGMESHTHLTLDDLGPTGCEILDAACAGADREEIEARFTAWADALYASS